MRKLFCLLQAIAFSVLTLSAQSGSSTFSVLSFRKLDWDLDARSNYPVNDQNGHKAALIKVVTPMDGFDFDVGVMGVVSVRQETGEIWVYVPEKVRKITIRHREFGVIRDYDLGIPLESATVYELILATPLPAVRDTVVVKDSIVYVPAPAEISAKHHRQKGFSALATASAPDLSFGTMLLWCGKFGGYVNLSSNFKSASYDYGCSSDGTADGGYIWTSGKSRISRMSVSAGGTMKCTDWLYVCAGAGYGRRLLLWEDSAGRWAQVKENSFRGISADAGALLRFGKLAIYAGATTIRFRSFSAELGAGLNF